MSFAKYVNMDEDLSLIQYGCVAVGCVAVCAYKALVTIAGSKTNARWIQGGMLLAAVVVALSDFAQPPDQMKPKPEEEEEDEGEAPAEAPKAAAAAESQKNGKKGKKSKKKD